MRQYSTADNRSREERRYRWNNCSVLVAFFSVQVICARCIEVDPRFCGDLSWLGEGLPTYESLVQANRNVTVRVLTDKAPLTLIEQAKRYGMEFREYPNGAIAPLKASITDADEESAARALVVKRRIIARGPKPGAPYEYWMKIYRGPEDYSLIKGAALLFDELFSKGKSV